MTTPDPMAEIRASFFVECEELLEALQDALAHLAEAAAEGGAADPETINVAFRAVHSIKGGAGAFGLTALVAFAHGYESAMDALRAGRLTLTRDGAALFFRAADLLADHVRLARDGVAEAPAAAANLLDELGALCSGDGPAEAADEGDFVPLALPFDFDAAGAEGEATAEGEAEDEADLQAKADPPAGWLVRLRPGPGFYASGNEVVHLLRALAALGPADIVCERRDLPDLADLDPEAPCLGWRIALAGDVAEGELRGLFDFVEDRADIEVAPAAADEAEADEAEADEAEAEPPPAPLEPAPAPASVAAPAPPPAEAAPSLAPDTPAPGTAPAPPLPAQGIAPAILPTPASAPAAGGVEAGATVRVDVDRIDRLVNLVGELVINQAMLAQSVAEAGLPANSAVATGLEAFMMLTRDIQDSVMTIRAQPVKPLFQRMARIVREAAASVGKQVRLRCEGEATEVDKTVIERLADPLTHMIRNAVDHGLEPPTARRAAGKPEEGTITLSARHRAGRVVIVVADDGGGIDRARVRAKALERGLIAPDAVLTEAEIDNLLFLPGFSTADKVSALSGRGVGMDVVRRAIQALGGRISIASDRGRGTRFSISLPLTLAVLDGMVVRAAGETLVVPLSAIVETAALAPGSVSPLGPGMGVIRNRGSFVPLVDLGAELGFRPPLDDAAGRIVLMTAQEDGSRAALIVDEIVEQRQVVIKGLQSGYGRCRGIAAATILGDGRIALILDPGGLMPQPGQRLPSGAAPFPPVPPPPEFHPEPRPAHAG
ncbi:chemotaxis protein CheA [Frigidibacter oleivorans]|uniref:chemotaxis protein CheA n=1 Tax=Frigidibacter oleivorans TaxID=2487129 RepID=UPI000F8EFFE9|nr:chemotaxis protein CheA [Frigidibacter oleivorans]